MPILVNAPARRVIALFRKAHHDAVWRLFERYLDEGHIYKNDLSPAAAGYARIDKTNLFLDVYVAEEVADQFVAEIDALLGDDAYSNEEIRAILTKNPKRFAFMDILNDAWVPTEDDMKDED
jgi:hypothetical protein